MQNLNQWREWLNNTSEQEWANFAAQHGGQLEAIQQAWAAFIAQPCQMQPENTVDNELQTQPENQHGAAARRQDGIQGQPENVAASEPQTPTQTNFRLPETLTQLENAMNNEPQRQPENTNGAAAAHRQHDAQQQPENTTASDTQTPTQTNFRQPENVSTDEPQQQPETQNKATTVNRQHAAQQQPENTAANEPQTLAQTDFKQPENAVTNDTQRQPEKVFFAVV